MKPIFARNSWHRRLYEWTYLSHPERIAICPYFWSVVLAVLTYPFRRLWRIPSYDTKENIYTVLGLGILGFIGIAVVLIVYRLIVTQGILFFLIGVGIVVGGVSAVILAIIGLARLFEAVDRYIESRRKPEVLRPPKPMKPKQPNVLWEFLKAKKEKICPYVEWRD